ncbi:hypothetical protein [Pedobacter africanus]|uniref:PH domain-containing protein n=1 Tax=Pedobacter africanus TaxID=151894 RepID=A0A1W2DI89_9SPHI|nr:hypothetical protein [Pedobacter africanus]SMC96686.1 hypothetical protein SAMN04488524_3804 [Pedobacter africanus]
MKPVVIKKTWKTVPIELMNTGLAVFGGLYLMFAYWGNMVVFILSLIYLLIVTVIAFYVIISLRLYSHITIKTEGLIVDNKEFYPWENIESYFVEESSYTYFSADTGHGTASEKTLVVRLKDEHSLRLPLAQLNKKPGQIIELLDELRYVRIEFKQKKHT